MLNSYNNSLVSKLNLLAEPSSTWEEMLLSCQETPFGLVSCLQGVWGGEGAPTIPDLGGSEGYRPHTSLLRKHFHIAKCCLTFWTGIIGHQEKEKRLWFTYVELCSSRRPLDHQRWRMNFRPSTEPIPLSMQILSPSKSTLSAPTDMYQHWGKQYLSVHRIKDIACMRRNTFLMHSVRVWDRVDGPDWKRLDQNSWICFDEWHCWKVQIKPLQPC